MSSELGLAADAQPTDTFATIADVPIQPDTSRVNPNQVSSGVTRGTQIIANQDGSQVTLGGVPDGSTDFGIAYFNAAGKLISKNTGATQYIYDLTTNKNIMQIGKLPDGSYGMVVAKAGYNVSDLFA